MATKLTLQQRIVRYMEAHGYTAVVPSPSKRYKAYRYGKAVDSTRILYIGRSGAVRSAPNGAVSYSFSITEKIMAMVEQWEKEQGYVKEQAVSESETGG